MKNFYLFYSTEKLNKMENVLLFGEWGENMTWDAPLSSEDVVLQQLAVPELETFECHKGTDLAAVFC